MGILRSGTTPATARQVWLRSLPSLAILVVIGIFASVQGRPGRLFLLSVLPWALVWLAMTWTWARRVARGVDQRAWRWRALAELLVVVGAVSLVLSLLVVWRSGWPPAAYLLALMPLPMLGLGLWGLRRFPVPRDPPTDPPA